MQIPELLTIGHPRLMTPQAEVSPAELASTEFHDRLQVLKAAMVHYQGIGIAAPQIGWHVRVFCLGIEDAPERYPGAPHIPFSFWINPSITAFGDTAVWSWEGCLSVPGMRGWVERPEWVTVAGLDELGQPQEQTLNQFASRVWQHEYDHLEGILYPMRVAHPRWLLPQASLALQADWPLDWPSVGSAVTPPGQLSARA